MWWMISTEHRCIRTPCPEGGDESSAMLVRRPYDFMTCVTLTPL